MFFEVLDAIADYPKLGQLAAFCLCGFSCIAAWAIAVSAMTTRMARSEEFQIKFLPMAALMCAVLTGLAAYSWVQFAH